MQIKKEKDMFKKDLTDDDKSYVYYLKPALDDHSLEDFTDVNKMKAAIVKIIEPARDTETKRKFLLNLQFKRSCTDVLFYVYNSVFNGSGLGVI